MNSDKRRAVVREVCGTQDLVRESDGSPRVFPYPSLCTLFLGAVRRHQLSFKNDPKTTYTMVALDDPLYRKLEKQKTTPCRSPTKT